MITIVEIAPESLSEFRRTTLQDDLLYLSPDGFVTATREQADQILRDHGWSYNLVEIAHWEDGDGLNPWAPGVHVD